jgi:DNA-binding FrmR family transcriptional regulator
MLSATPPAGSGPPAEAANCLRQLRGQIDEIIAGLEGPSPCPPVLRRIYAIQDQLHAVQRTLVRHHLKECLQRVAQAPDETAAQQVLTDIHALYSVRRDTGYPHGSPAEAH